MFVILAPTVQLLHFLGVIGFRRFTTIDRRITTRRGTQGSVRHRKSSSIGTGRRGLRQGYVKGYSLMTSHSSVRGLAVLLLYQRQWVLKNKCLKMWIKSWWSRSNTARGLVPLKHPPTCMHPCTVQLNVLLFR